MQAVNTPPPRPPKIPESVLVVIHTPAPPMTIAVSSATSRSQVCTSGSSTASFEPVTLCQ
jgi:hypothetical protein